VAVLREGVVTFQRAYGMADLERHVAITPRTVFDTQSLSKEFVAYTTLLLVRDGKLALDDDVRRWIPELPDYGTPITVRHLLQHTSGLRDSGILAQDVGGQFEETATREQLLDLIFRQKALNYTPGAAHSYTNSGYLLLPLIVERIEKKPFAAVIRERVFEPAGMTSTRWRDDRAEVIDNRAVGYRHQDDGTYHFGANSHNGVFTTIEDLAHWDRHLDRDADGRALFAQMTTPGVLPSGEAIEYGFGVEATKYRGLPADMHGGDAPDGTAIYARFPDQRVGLALLCNGHPADFRATNLAPKVADIVLKDVLGAPESSASTVTVPLPAPQPITPAELQRVAGSYFGEWGGPWVRTFAVRDGALKLIFDDKSVVDMIPIGDGRFRAATSDAVYSFSRDGRSVERVLPKQRTLSLERVEPAGTPRLEDFAGIYSNTEVDSSITVTAHDGKLWYARPRLPADALAPMFRDAFEDNGLVLRFTRDAGGRVTGLTTHWDRVWRMPYVHVR
jgi:CubicO group peptidase (beta-lactamase class C family)